MLLKGVLKLGSDYEAAKQYNSAIEIYQRGMEVDDLAEVFYQRLITCYLKKNRYSDAVDVYARCERTLFAKFGVKPSEKTMSLMKKIKTIPQHDSGELPSRSVSSH